MAAGETNKTNETDKTNENTTDGEGAEGSMFGEVVFSPVCTWCAHWQPGDGRHCAGAYPKGVGGPQIPLPIWRGDNLHLTPYPNAAHPTDHRVTFELHPDANLDALKAANPALYNGYVAREQGNAPQGQQQASQSQM